MNWIILLLTKSLRFSGTTVQREICSRNRVSAFRFTTVPDHQLCKITLTSVYLSLRSAFTSSLKVQHQTSRTHIPYGIAFEIILVFGIVWFDLQRLWLWLKNQALRHNSLNEAKINCWTGLPCCKLRVWSTYNPLDTRLLYLVLILLSQFHLQRRASISLPSHPFPRFFEEVHPGTICWITCWAVGEKAG